MSQFDERACNERGELLWQERKIRIICKLLSTIEPKGRGADVGCGSGFASLAYLQAGIRILDGFDVSDVSLEMARAKGINAMRWNADGEPCPVADGTYDVVIAGDIIEHLVDTDTFTNELRRILRPTGTAIVTTPNLSSWYNRIRLVRGRVPIGYPGVSPTFRRDAMVDNNHIRVNTTGEWVGLFEAHGFSVVRLLGWSVLQIWQGGIKTKLLKAIGRMAEHRPTLAESVIFVLHRGWP